MKQSNKIYFLLIFVLINIIVSCENSEINNLPEPDSLYEQPYIVALDTVVGYNINPFKGDSIQNVILFTDDTLGCGQKVIANSKIINLDTFPSPDFIPFKISKIELFSSPVIISDSVESSFLVSDKKMVVDEFHLVNKNKDTLPTGEFVTSKGETIFGQEPEVILVHGADVVFGNNMSTKLIGADQGLNAPGNKYGQFPGICSDRDGNIWFPGSGLNKYDGERVHRYSNSQGILGNSIWSLYIAKNGNVWMGVVNDGNGLSKFDGKGFTHYKPKDGFIVDVVKSISEFRNGDIWTGDGILMIISEKGMKYLSTNEGVPTNKVDYKYSDGDNMWFSDNGNGFYRFDGEEYRLYSKENGFQSNIFGRMAMDSMGNYWVAHYGEGLTMFNDEKIYKIDLPGNDANDVEVGYDGNVWISNNSGLHMYNGNKLISFSENNAMSAGYISDVSMDNCGNIWIKTDDGFNIIDVTFQNYNYLEDYNPAEMKLMAFRSDIKTGWFVNDKKEFYLQRKGFLSKIENSEYIQGKSFWSDGNIDEDGNLWLIMSEYDNDGFGLDQFLIKLDSTGMTKYTMNSGMLSLRFDGCFIDSKERLWVNYWEGPTYIKDGKMTVLMREQGFPGEAISKVVEDTNGNIWIGTYNSGVIKYDGESFQSFTEREGMLSNQVNDFCFDNNGNMWLAHDEGVVMFDQNNFYLFEESQGLYSNTTSSLGLDSNGTIWAASNNPKKKVAGLTKIEWDDKNSKFKLIAFDHKDGLPKVVGFSAIQDPMGNLLRFRHDNGVIEVPVDSYKIATSAPNMLVTEVIINEHSIGESNVNDSILLSYDELTSFYNIPVNLKLPYSHNNVRLGFAGIDWHAPHKIKYSFRMKDYDESWSLPSKTPFAEYKNLPPGSYMFEVVSIGESQEWSEPAVFKFEVLPPWYRTWWAYIFYGVIGIGVLYLIFKARTAKLRKRQEELEGEVELATQEIRHKKEEIEEQHREIKDSMEYAKRIQSAILPPTKLVKEYLKDSFILYKPKDIVAGDFYWMEHVNGKILFAAADCTGHGVPGAMVSVICNGALNRSVREFGLVEPGNILGKAREIVIAEFEKSEEEVKDGMDIALCSLEGNTLKYAGAHNPLWLIRNGEIIETKANKQPIGKFDNPLPYDTHTLNLEKGDTIYVFSDGFVDQFGGEKGKKFKPKAFRALLLSVQDQSMESQMKLINEAFEAWRGELEQIDDVCVIGVRV